MLEIHEEIRAFQRADGRSPGNHLIDRFVWLPGLIRRAILRLLFQNPRLIKRSSGTVMVSSIGMFGEGGGWGLAVPNHTLQLTLGGIAKKPGVADDRIEIREYLSVTISFDHDIVDGAPAARFTQRLKELVESGYSLGDYAATNVYEPLMIHTKLGSI